MGKAHDDFLRKAKGKHPFRQAEAPGAGKHPFAVFQPGKKGRRLIGEGGHSPAQLRFARRAGKQGEHQARRVAQGERGNAGLQNALVQSGGVLPDGAAGQDQAQGLLRLNILQRRITAQNSGQNAFRTQLARHSAAGVIIKVQHQHHIAHGTSLLWDTKIMDSGNILLFDGIPEKSCMAAYSPALSRAFCAARARRAKRVSRLAMPFCAMPA